MDKLQALFAATKNNSIDQIIKTCRKFNSFQDLTKLYIFDFDDTLFWTPRWQSEATVDGNGIVIEVRDSPGLSRSFSFLSKKGLGLKKAIVTHPDKKVMGYVVFAVVDNLGKNIEIDSLEELIPKEDLISNGIDLRGKYIPLPAVTDDILFYSVPETLGTMPRKDGVDLYKEHRENSIILTARQGYPGVEDRIGEILQEQGGGLPLQIFTKGLDNEPSDKYKAEIITQIAADFPNLLEINFYDDNIRYINRVNSFLEDYDFTHKTNIAKKVKTHHMKVDSYGRS